MRVVRWWWLSHGLWSWARGVRVHVEGRQLQTESEQGEESERRGESGCGARRWWGKDGDREGMRGDLGGGESKVVGRQRRVGEEEGQTV